MEKIVIPARPSDDVLIKNIDDVSFDKIFHEPLEYYEKCFEMGHHIFLLMVNGLAAGEVILRVDDEETLGIESFAIVPQFRNQGLSKYLLEFVDDFAKSYKKIILEVYVKNKKAIDIYKKNGYNVSNTLENFYSDGVNAYRMEKLL
jgi:ribosomal protein S18 acetylase RimI-like enzyme